MRELIRNNVEMVREKIAKSAEKAGRKEQEILLVAVSKTQPLEKIYQAYEAGITNFGENKVQDLVLKIAESKFRINWHFVGHLQTNKVNKVVGNIEMIQSVDSDHLLEKVSIISQNKGCTSKILLQVNTSGEDSKFGFDPEKVSDACELVEQLPNIEINGLMTIGPLTSDKMRVAQSFIRLRLLFEKLRNYGSDKVNMTYLSMGMTGDFELAILEGSNLVRIGTAIFGARL